jgi:DNA processing protein
MKKESVRDWLALSLWDNLGPSGQECLRTSVPEPWRALTDKKLLNIVFSKKKNPGTPSVNNLRKQADILIALAEKNTFGFITTLDSQYPELLANISAPPPVLYFIGNATLLNKPAIAVVGSRRPTRYGKDVAAYFSETLAEKGFVIVSGLAMGIDGIAHSAALKGNSKTVAVLGCGLDNPYPKTNRAVREQIEQSGCIVSEFPWGTPPNPGQFPRRNRIISGLSLGVLIVESTEKSGALITVRHAIDQNRDVFAVPGSIFVSESKGPIRVLQNGGYPVMVPEDIVSYYSIQKPIPFSEHYNLAEQFDIDSEQRPVWDLLDTVPVSIDELIGALQWEASEIHNVLLKMELLGLITQLPGQRFVRAVKPLRQKE